MAYLEGHLEGSDEGVELGWFVGIDDGTELGSADGRTVG